MMCAVDVHGLMKASLALVFSIVSTLHFVDHKCESMVEMKLISNPK